MKTELLSKEMISQLQEIVGESFLFLDEETRNNYGHDETEDYVFPPSVVLKPASAEEIAAILKLANQHAIPVTPIGGKTGLSGGALSIHQGIGLSMERFNKILHIDEQNLQVIISHSMTP